jgi:hypothetical protein
MADTIKINRAPVLTLWGVIVAERLGYNHDEALTLGKAMAGLNAQSKGQRLGLFKPAESAVKAEGGEKSDERQAGETFMVEVVGRPVPATHTEHGLRATAKGEAIDPKSVERYLQQKYGARLAEASLALQALAQAYSPQELERRAYTLYEQFRPEVPEGTRGWGAAGDLDLQRIRRLAEKGQES